MVQVSSPDARIAQAIQRLSAQPVDLHTAGRTLGRGSGLYAWWAAPAVFPELIGVDHDDDPTLRLLYLGRATSLRGRILRTDLRRSDGSSLRRTLAGLLMPTEHYRTQWTDQVVLSPGDEARLTRWMHGNLRLTWAEDPAPDDLEAELVHRLAPPLNLHGVDPADVPPTVRAARERYDSSAKP
jgi:hypothetical protein